ncbi:MAG: YncE family protein [Sphingobacteriia bacterium]|nr:YncE family protein [Sphingobacteriia bacterium]
MKVFLKRFFLYFIFLSFSSCNGQEVTQKSKYLSLINTIKFSDIKGRIDHFTYDLQNGKIYIAALGNNTVEEIDIKNFTRTHTIQNFSEPQGIVYLPKKRCIAVANGANGKCDFISTKSYDKIKSIQLDDNADNIRYDSLNEKIYVGFGNGGIAIIDADTFDLINTIPLVAHPESFQIEYSTNKMYVNIPDKKMIAVIDLIKNKVVEQRLVEEASSNFPMSINQDSHLLFIGCRNPSKLLIQDSYTGKSKTSIPISSDVDDIFFDKVRKRLYISCGEGSVNIIEQKNINEYSLLEKMITHSGSRTSLFIPEFNYFIVASPSKINRDAQLLIYKTN